MSLIYTEKGEVDGYGKRGKRVSKADAEDASYLLLHGYVERGAATKEKPEEPQKDDEK